MVSIRSPRRNEGRLLLPSLNRLRISVSIRSPRRNEGRQKRLAALVSLDQFQSAPPAETRGDSAYR